MKKITLIFTLLFSICLYAQDNAEKKQIKGVVLSRILASDRDNAIPGVVIKNEEGKTVAKTNTYGEFEFDYSIPVSGEKPSFTISKKEYFNKNSNIF